MATTVGFSKRYMIPWTTLSPAALFPSNTGIGTVCGGAFRFINITCALVDVLPMKPSSRPLTTLTSMCDPFGSYLKTLRG